MFCPNCGKQLADNAAFCDACGESVYAGFAPSDIPPEPQPTVEQQPPVYEQPPVQPMYEQPMYEQPQPAYAPYTPPVQKKTRVGALRNFLATIPAFFMVVLIIVASLLLCAQAAFSKNTMRSFLETMIDTEGISISSFKDASIPKNAVEEIVDLQEIKDWFIDETLIIYEKSLYGADYDVLDADRVVDILKANADKIEDACGYRLTDENYENIKREINDIKSEDLPDFKSLFAESFDIDEDTLEVLYAIMSPVTVIVILAIAAALLALMFLIRRFYMSTFIWGGVVTLSGTLVPALLMFVFNVAATEYTTGTTAMTYASAIISNMTPVLIGFAVAGVAMIVLGIVLSIVQKAHRNKA